MGSLTINEPSTDGQPDNDRQRTTTDNGRINARTQLSVFSDTCLSHNNDIFKAQAQGSRLKRSSLKLKPQAQGLKLKVQGYSRIRKNIQGRLKDNKSIKELFRQQSINSKARRNKMINFNKNSAWNLTPIGLNSIHNDVAGLMIQGEQPVMAFKTIRDQLVFTNKRIISIDVQGITGKRRSFTSLPYSKIQFFAIQTPGFAELVPDSELFLRFANGFEATFEFRGNVDIGLIGRMISGYVLT